MEKIQVLALNDDNHAISFALRGKVFSNYMSFIRECLAKPHQNEFEIRGIYICDYYEGIDMETMDILFSLVETDPKYLDGAKLVQRQRAFSTLWEVADKENIYVYLDE